MKIRSDISDGWFTVEQFDDCIYALSEYAHWEQSHSYLVMGEDRAALIDTGLGVADIKAVVQRLTRLPIVVVTTHVHWDHIGGHDGFADVAVHRDDADWLRHGIPVPLESLRANFTRERPTTPYPEDFDPASWEAFMGEPTRLLNDGDEINLGGRALRVLHTPGHSPGHICLYDPSTGTVFTADLIYRGQLYAFYPSTDPEAFARSVDLITGLCGVRRIAPGHGSLDVEVDFLDVVAEAFHQLQADGQLRHGSGIHDFGRDLSIKL